MRLLLLLGLTAFIPSYLGVGVIRKVALKRGVLDVPNERSSHKTPTPRGGGLAVAVVLLVGSVAFATHSVVFPLDVLWAYIAGAALVGGVSLADDMLGVQAGLRLCAHVAAAGVAIAGLGWFHAVSVPWLGNIEFGRLGIVLTLLWIVGVTNIYNFMDGIDGLAAGQAVVAGLFWLAASLDGNSPRIAVLSCMTVGASLGFLLHNLPPARIFLGDVGSTALGFTFAILPLLAGRETQRAGLWVFGALCIAPFAFDGTWTILRRIGRRENLFEPHRSHLYQRLVAGGSSHGRVTAIYAALAVCSGAAGLADLTISGAVGGTAVALDLAMLTGFAWSVGVRERRGPSAAGTARSARIAHRSEK